MFNKILVPLDQSPIAECVLPHAAAFAKIYDAEVRLVHVLECPSPTDRYQPIDPLAWKFCKAEAEAYLNNVEDRFQQIGLAPKSILLEGQPAQAIVNYARSHAINLIMMSSHGKTGLSRWNVNSVVRKILQASSISSFIVRAYNPAVTDLEGLRYSRLLVPLDGSLRSECVLPTAETFAQRHQASLFLSHVVVKPEIPRQTPLEPDDIELIQRFVDRNMSAAENYFQRLLKRLTVDFIPRVLVSENIAISLHQLVEDEEVDLVVISAHGHSGHSQWPFGSLTSSFIEYGTTPLLVVQDLAQNELTLSRAEAAAQEIKGH
ncbi:MAG: universal stress protein [Anaerolineales bacterium]|nr:MAG: universal stress protein [Anaerolineales bacterium]